MVSKVGSIQGQSDFLLTQKPNEGGKAQAFNCVAASGSKIKIRESIGFFFSSPVSGIIFPMPGMLTPFSLFKTWLIS